MKELFVRNGSDPYTSTNALGIQDTLQATHTNSCLDTDWQSALCVNSLYDAYAKLQYENELLRHQIQILSQERDLEQQYKKISTPNTFAMSMEEHSASDVIAQIGREQMEKTYQEKIQQLQHQLSEFKQLCMRQNTNCEKQSLVYPLENKRLNMSLQAMQNSLDEAQRDKKLILTQSEQVQAFNRKMQRQQQEVTRKMAISRERHQHCALVTIFKIVNCYLRRLVLRGYLKWRTHSLQQYVNSKVEEINAEAQYRNRIQQMNSELQVQERATSSIQHRRLRWHLNCWYTQAKHASIAKHIESDLKLKRIDKQKRVYLSAWITCHILQRRKCHAVQVLARKKDRTLKGLSFTLWYRQSLCIYAARLRTCSTALHACNKQIGELQRCLENSESERLFLFSKTQQQKAQYDEQTKIMSDLHNKHTLRMMQYILAQRNRRILSIVVQYWRAQSLNAKQRRVLCTRMRQRRRQHAIKVSLCKWKHVHREHIKYHMIRHLMLTHRNRTLTTRIFLVWSKYSALLRANAQHRMSIFRITTTNHFWQIWRINIFRKLKCRRIISRLMQLMQAKVISNSFTVWKEVNTIYNKERDVIKWKCMEMTLKQDAQLLKRTLSQWKLTSQRKVQAKLWIASYHKRRMIKTMRTVWAILSDLPQFYHTRQNHLRIILSKHHRLFLFSAWSQLKYCVLLSRSYADTESILRAQESRIDSLHTEIAEKQHRFADLERQLQVEKNWKLQVFAARDDVDRLKHTQCKLLSIRQRQNESIRKKMFLSAWFLHRKVRVCSYALNQEKIRAWRSRIIQKKLFIWKRWVAGKKDLRGQVKLYFSGVIAQRWLRVCLIFWHHWTCKRITLQRLLKRHQNRLVRRMLKDWRRRVYLSLGIQRFKDKWVTHSVIRKLEHWKIVAKDAQYKQVRTKVYEKLKRLQALMLHRQLHQSMQAILLSWKSSPQNTPRSAQTVLVSKKDGRDVLLHFIFLKWSGFSRFHAKRLRILQVLIKRMCYRNRLIAFRHWFHQVVRCKSQELTATSSNLHKIKTIAEQRASELSIKSLAYKRFHRIQRRVNCLWYERNILHKSLKHWRVITKYETQVRSMRVEQLQGIKRVLCKSFHFALWRHAWRYIKELRSLHKSRCLRKDDQTLSRVFFAWRSLQLGSRSRKYLDLTLKFQQWHVFVRHLHGIRSMKCYELQHRFQLRIKSSAFSVWQRLVKAEQWLRNKRDMLLQMRTQNHDRDKRRLILAMWRSRTTSTQSLSRKQHTVKVLCRHFHSRRVWLRWVNARNYKCLQRLHLQHIFKRMYSKVLRLAISTWTQYLYRCLREETRQERMQLIAKIQNVECKTAERQLQCHKVQNDLLKRSQSLLLSHRTQNHLRGCQILCSIFLKTLTKLISVKDMHLLWVHWKRSTEICKAGRRLLERIVHSQNVRRKGQAWNIWTRIIAWRRHRTTMIQKQIRKTLWNAFKFWRLSALMRLKFRRVLIEFMHHKICWTSRQLRCKAWIAWRQTFKRKLHIKTFLTTQQEHGCLIDQLQKRCCLAQIYWRRHNWLNRQLHRRLSQWYRAVHMTKYSGPISSSLKTSPCSSIEDFVMRVIPNIRAMFHHMSQAATIEDYFDAVSTSFMQWLEMSAGILMLLDPAGQQLWHTHQSKRICIPSSIGLAGFALSNMQPLLLHDVTNDCRFHPLADQHVIAKLRRSCTMSSLCEDKTQPSTLSMYATALRSQDGSTHGVLQIVYNHTTKNGMIDSYRAAQLQLCGQLCALFIEHTFDGILEHAKDHSLARKPETISKLYRIQKNWPGHYSDMRKKRRQMAQRVEELESRLKSSVATSRLPSSQLKLTEDENRARSKKVSHVSEASKGKIESLNAILREQKALLEAKDTELRNLQHIVSRLKLMSQPQNSRKMQRIFEKESDHTDSPKVPTLATDITKQSHMLLAEKANLQSQLVRMKADNLLLIKAIQFAEHHDGQMPASLQREISEIAQRVHPV